MPDDAPDQSIADVTPQDRPTPSLDLEAEIVQFLGAQPQGKSVHPSSIARNLAGSNEKEWRLLMKPLRQASTAMARAGTLEIIRKGKVVDPLNFKGVYQIRLCGQPNE